MQFIAFDSTNQLIHKNGLLPKEKFLVCGRYVKYFSAIIYSASKRTASIEGGLSKL